jgi:hypothetical protein
MDTQAPRNELQEWFDITESRRGFCRVGRGKSAHLTKYNDESLCGKLLLPDNGGAYIDRDEMLGMTGGMCGSCWRVMLAEVEQRGDTTSRVYALLTGESANRGELWESCSLRTAAEFEADARRILGDATEVSTAQLDGADWSALRRDFLDVPAWVAGFRASLGPLSRETFDALHPEWI